MYTNHGGGHLQGGPQCQGTWDFQGKISPYGLIFPGGGPEANRQNILICEIWAVDKQVCSIVSCLKMSLNLKKSYSYWEEKLKPFCCIRSHLITPRSFPDTNPWWQLAFCFSNTRYQSGSYIVRFLVQHTSFLHL